jgi:hypothetical protein
MAVVSGISLPSTTFPVSALKIRPSVCALPISPPFSLLPSMPHPRTYSEFSLILFFQANWDNCRWKRSLLRARGVAMGKEHVGKGVNIALGPMMNIGRVAQGGRNWEGFGADPFLAGVGAYETILGMQSAGVQACAKHYINK